MSRPNFPNSFTKTIHSAPYAAIDPTQPSLSAAGKTILITAGHTGIGFTIAQNFAIAGASHIILIGRRLEVLEKSAKELKTKHSATKFHHFASSITNYAKIEEIFSKIRSTISANIDVLVTSAAYAAPSSLTIDLPSEELSASFDTNLFANANLVREFLSRIPEPGSGKEKIILDISTVAAHVVMPQLGAYGVSKLAFTQWLAHVQQDNAENAVRTHSFHPGSIFTEAAKAFGMKEDSFPWDDADLPGQFAVWLASKEATFLRGRFVWAKWDVQELMERKGDFENDPKLLKVALLG